MSIPYIASILTILLFLMGVWRLIWKFLVRKFSKYSPYSSVAAFVRNHLEKDDVRKVKSLRIAIVDDQPENYPVDEGRKAGFDITVYESVSLTDYSFLSEYNVVFLDITNVVEEDPKRGGFSLIERMKSEFPDVLVVGISSKRFDPTLSRFWELTDFNEKTPISFIDFEGVVSELWDQHFSPFRISSKIDSSLEEASLSLEERRVANRSIMRFLDEKLNDKDLLRGLSDCSSDIDAHKIAGLANKLREVL